MTIQSNDNTVSTKLDGKLLYKLAPLKIKEFFPNFRLTKQNELIWAFCDVIGRFHVTPLSDGYCSGEQLKLLNMTIWLIAQNKPYTTYDLSLSQDKYKALNIRLTDVNWRMLLALKSAVIVTEGLLVERLFILGGSACFLFR